MFKYVYKLYDKGFGYMIKFSCLYIPQGHYFISTVWLRSTDEYVHFWFCVKVHL